LAVANAIAFCTSAADFGATTAAGVEHLLGRTELGTAGLNDLPPDRGGQTVPAGDGRVGGGSSRPEHHAGRERPGGTAQKSLTRDLCRVFRHIGHLCPLEDAGCGDASRHNRTVAEPLPAL
jgi:hypothetical protein